MKKQSGFTLIELLLVLAIIGIISAIAIPALLGQRARARDKAAIANGAGLISEFVADWDKAHDTNTQPTDAATFLAMLTANVPTFTTAINPWGTTALGYNQAIYLEASKAMALSIAGATAAAQGQVQVGFFPPPAGGTGGVGYSVYVNTAVNGSHVVSGTAGLD